MFLEFRTCLQTNWTNKVGASGIWFIIFTVVEDILCWHHQPELRPMIMKNNIMRSSKHITGMFLDLDGLCLKSWHLVEKYGMTRWFHGGFHNPTAHSSWTRFAREKWHTLSGHGGLNPSWKEGTHGWFLCRSPFIIWQVTLEALLVTQNAGDVPITAPSVFPVAARVRKPWWKLWS